VSDGKFLSGSDHSGWTPAADDEVRFAVRPVGAGCYHIAGALSFLNARAALKTLGDVMNEERGDVLLDLGEVTRADSAGLALLIEAMRLARQRELRLRLRNLPAQVEALAVVSGVDAMLPRADQGR
jgi:phospholipid transport system transporter-binding protein